MYVLDTNVLSELRPGKPQASATVRAWAATMSHSQFFLSAVAVVEQEIGIVRLERSLASSFSTHGRTRHDLELWLASAQVSDQRSRFTFLRSRARRTCRLCADSAARRSRSRRLSRTRLDNQRASRKLAALVTMRTKMPTGPKSIMRRRPQSTRTTPVGLKPRSAALPLRARLPRALLSVRISSVSSRSLPPRPMPSIRTLRV
jgi:predicted nucleic acid-binding protein